MKPEASFSARVRAGLLPYGADIERIENRVNLGIPDMLVGVLDRFVLLELKVVDRGLKVNLRPHQIAFMARQSAKAPRRSIAASNGNCGARNSIVRNRAERRPAACSDQDVALAQGVRLAQDLLGGDLERGGGGGGGVRHKWVGKLRLPRAAACLSRSRSPSTRAPRTQTY